ncbi:hypothetical protein SEA_KOZIE_61 [Microbacterium phage Kozie]|uniref:Uncharacterized protein n=1 Tax=Microbacterium phage Kozie TaxID=2885981 RepID=A0AAE8YAK6_9CAUD|nr:hypothetical protein QC998_gp61 [Microbacterium phage Kozie]UDL16257.1 hypothetical protein SEA_KOZIE_61 [Microbacterium phage Kozie]
MNATATSLAKAVQTPTSGWIVVCREAGHAILSDLGRTAAYKAARTATCPECERRAALAAEPAPDMSEVFEAEAMRDEAEENGDPIAAALADVALAVALGDKPARNAAIIRAREAGASVDDLATAANIVTSTVYDVLRGSSAPSGGVSSLREYQKGYQEALADILALTDAGKTRDESLLMIEEWISNNRLAAAASIFARRAQEG